MGYQWRSSLSVTDDFMSSAFLMYIPLTVAFPLTGIQKVIIIMFAAFVLKESVSRIEWAGVLLISLGIVFIVIP